MSSDERAFLDDYLEGVDETRVHWQLIHLAMGSVADVCIIPDAGYPRIALIRANEPAADIAGELAVASFARPIR